MKKKGFIFVLVLMLALFAGCSGDSGEVQNEEIRSVDSSMELASFDRDLMEYISEKTDGNYMVSPLSLRYALGMLLSGSSGETKEELLAALQITEEQEWEDYCSTLNSFASSFEAEEDEERALRIADSIWKREDLPKDFTEEFRKKTEESYGAEFLEFKPDNGVKRINTWADEKTEGLIPKLLPEDYEMDNLSIVLMNALYFKDAWESPFMKESTYKGTFHGIDGKETEKDFMVQEGTFRYYGDEETRLVILPMKGDVYMAFTIGDTGAISEKVTGAESCRIRVTVPQIDLETDFCHGEFKDFLRSRGAESVFAAERADFSSMIDDPVFIDDIIQKTKITMDEGGVEAAAVTSVMMKSTAVADEPKTFTADEPFSFFIYTTCDDRTEVMFAGEIRE